MALKDLLKNVTQTFINLLPNGGGKSTTDDSALTIKTSPTIWEYEMFRLEWDRRTVLREIDQMMKADTRIKRANHVFASTAVRRGINVTVTSEVSEDLANRGQEVINQLMRDCQVNAKLSSWGRLLLKEGDLFLNPVIDLRNRKIKNIKRLPAITMQRNDDMTGNFPDVNKAFQQIDPITLAPLQEFPLWSINHIRYDHEEGERYGQSQYLACRGYWKKLDMTEQDLVVRRRTRAVPRRLHSIGNKDNPADWSEVEKYKDLNKLNSKTSQVTTDYYGNGLTDVKDLNADAQLDHIKDVDHLQEVYMLGTGVPLHILGFGQGVNRDIVEDQKKQFEEDCQELRNLLEYGDSSPYSGLRFIFDFALALAGIDPTLCDYNIRWFENDNESANDRVDRVIKLRSSQPDPLISKKLALTVVSKDLGLEGEAAVEAELEAIKTELDEDRLEQQTIEGTLNPLKPNTAPIGKSTAVSSGKPTTDAKAINKTGNNVYFPLHGKKFAKMEKQLADDVRRNYQAVHEAIEPELEEQIEKIHVLKGAFGDAAEKNDPTLTEKIIALFNQAWADQEDTMVNDFFSRYQDAAKFGRENAAKDVKVEVTADFINPNVANYLREQAADRVKGINETTKDLLRKELAAAYQNKEDVASWMQRIKKVLDCNSPKGRAQMVARTELAFAYSKGLLSTYQEIGIHMVTWLAVMDNRTCSQCAERHGNDYPLKEAEENLPQHPNCRCTVVAAN